LSVRDTVVDSFNGKFGLTLFQRFNKVCQTWGKNSTNWPMHPNESCNV